MTDAYVTPRCCLSVPATDERRFAKAAASGADEIVLDLEDSVPPGGKDEARERVAAWLATQEVPAGVSVRVNAPRSPWCHADIVAVGGSAGADRSIVVPKVENAGDLAFVDRLLDGVEAAAGRVPQTSVQALIESPEGLANLGEIMTATRRLRAVILGYADLGAALGRSPDAGADSWAPARHAMLVAARTAGVAAIDGPFLGVDADEPFTDAVRHAARFGFDGKWVIHPRQVAAVVEAFTPTSAEVEHADRVLAALESGHARGAGAVELDGQMIDEALAVTARRTLAKAGRSTA
ncbi:CoA ester lyase [Haloechinothrix salitolerans]|uniref:HpcH/HpaI aldolase/citrate lyase family protein n=1 Tax=Haloechinothrix salitolerans TaxID=926830 RepID=A0ABW2BUR7_9PSEU